MADDIRVVVKVVGQQDIVKTTKSLKAMESGVKSLSKDLDAGRISGKQFNTGLKELRRNVDGSFPSWQKAKSSVDAYAKSVLQASSAAKQAKIDQEVAKVSASYDRLKASIDPVFAAQQRMKKAHAEIRAALKAEVITRDEAAASLRQYRTALKNGQVAGQALNKGMNRTGVLAQQAGYQFGDFAVQVQSGTNVMVAAGQQATQLVGTFAMLSKTTKGIMAFSALGVIIPVLTGIGAAFMRTKEAADDSGLAIKAFEERLKTAKEETAEMTEKLRFLQSGFGTESEFTLQEDFAAATAELERLESRLEYVKDPKAPFESAANRLSSISFIEEAIALQIQEKDLAEEALETYLDTLSALREEEHQREENLRLQKEAEIAAENYQKLVDETERSQKDRLALAEAERDYGKESVELAKLRAQQEGISKGLVGDALDAYIETEMAIREVEAATEDIAVATRESADAAERFSRALEAAALAGQTLATLKFEFSAGGRAMSLYAGRGTTSDRSIEGDLPEGYGQDIPPQGRGGGGTPFDQAAYLEALQKEADFKRSLVGMTEEQAAEAERRSEIINKIQAEGKVADEARIKTILATEAATRSLIEAEEQRQATMDMVTGHIESAFMSMVDGSKSVEDAFKGMLRAILLEIYQQQVAKPLAQSIGSFLFPNANGNAFSGGNVIPFANGGVVSSATMFPMAGNQTGVMGEAGPEAIMPLKRGANGKLGVQMEGGGGNTTVVQNFNFSANGDDSVKKIIAQAAPQIANMTKKSIMDDRRRGGQMKATFG